MCLTSREHCPDALGSSAAPVYVQEHGESEIPDDTRSLSSRGRGGRNAAPPVVDIEVEEPKPPPPPTPTPTPTKTKPSTDDWVPPSTRRPIVSMPPDQPEPADEGEQTEQYDKIRVHHVEQVKRGTKTKHIVHAMDGSVFETFSKTVAQQCIDASADELDVHVTWMPKKIGRKVFRDIESISVDDAPKPEAEVTEENW